MHIITMFFVRLVFAESKFRMQGYPYACLNSSLDTHYHDVFRETRLVFTESMFRMQTYP